MKVGSITLLVCVAIVACTRTTADEGRDASLQVSSDRAQFFRGSLPDGTDGPKVVSASMSTLAHQNAIDHAITGELEPSATAIAVTLAGDLGYWVVPAKIPLSAAPTSPTFDVVFGLSRAVSLGRHDVIVRAVDGEGRFGAPVTRPLDVGAARTTPAGRFVISLSWSNEADLDLHVVLPSGLEIFKRNRTEYQRPPPSAGPVPPNAPTDGGVLDRDSNAQCVDDGAHAEDVVWTEPPPRGHYTIRVDTFNLCGTPSSYWRVEAILDGVRLGASQGTSTDADLRFDHDRGAGVLALEVDVP